jgi:hypothetical protein
MAGIMKSWTVALLVVVSASMGAPAEAGAVDNQGAALDAATAAAISESVLWNFGTPGDGENPIAGLIFDLRGNLYSTTFEGGTNGDGTVFRLHGR